MQEETDGGLASLDGRLTAIEATQEHLATKADLANLELALRSDMAALETALRSDMAVLLTDMAALKATVTTAGWSLGILIAIAAILPQVSALVGQLGRRRAGGARLAETAGE